MAENPCPDREISYFGRVTCRPVDALTRAVLPAAAIGAGAAAMAFPGPQYDTPLASGVAKGAGAGALVGLALAATAYTKKATQSSAAAAVVGLVTIPAALYGAVKMGAVPTA